MEKQRYKGIFNFNGEVIVLWTHANGKGEAKRLFIIQLSEKLNRTPDSIRRYYSDGKANYDIRVTT